MKKLIRKTVLAVVAVMICLMLSVVSIGCANGNAESDNNLYDEPSVSGNANEETDSSNSDISEVPNNATEPDDSTEPDDTANKDLTEETDQPIHKHNLEFHADVSATCTNAGSFAFWRCTSCNKDYADEAATQIMADAVIPATGHQYVDKTIAPTCEDDGYTYHKCASCGDEYTDGEVAANGHSWGEFETVRNPTCTEDGQAKKTCSICGDIVPETLSAVGHQYVDKTVAPTCEDDGYTYHKCASCGDEYTDGEVAANGHSWGELKTVNNPTCTEDGQAKKICSACGATEEQPIAALGHSYIETVIAPTCAEKGHTAHVCTVCGNRYEDEETTATGHKYSDEWSSDEDYHWHDVICGCDVEPEKAPHNYVGGKCECGKEEAWDYRLIYTKINNDSEYAVSGIEVANGVAKSSLTVVIPSEYDGLHVTAIAERAFKDNVAIKRVEIPNTVIKIGANAFGGSSLKEAVFADTKNWTCRNQTILLGSVTSNAQSLTQTYKNYEWIKA